MSREEVKEKKNKKMKRKIGKKREKGRGRHKSQARGCLQNPDFLCLFSAKKREEKLRKAKLKEDFVKYSKDEGILFANN